MGVIFVVSIRTFEWEDANEFYNYLMKVADQTPYLSFSGEDVRVRFTPEMLASQIENDHLNISFLAIDRQKIIGLSQLSRNPLPRFANRAEFAISVDKDYWGKHIGSQLLEKTIQWGENRWHVGGIYLDVANDNERAFNLYSKYGFKIIGEYPILITVDGRDIAGKMMYKDLRNKPRVRKRSVSRYK
ncbi:MAG: GNAT family N-acetyltransferase [Lactobacillus sp.]|nr:MAG: GNAT family N-acetyltransferase [Lactobacillus sp.]